MVAPILTAKTTKRDIVLPKGTWVDGNDGTVYEGNQILKDYPAPLEILPYFLRKDSDAAAVGGSSQATTNITLFLCLFIISLLYTVV